MKFERCRLLGYDAVTLVTTYKSTRCRNLEYYNPHVVEVCTGPGLDLSPRPDQARGLGLGAQIMFGSGPGSNDSNETLYRTFRASWGHSLFTKKKLFVVALKLCS
jgi:hypothetical protein